MHAQNPAALLQAAPLPVYKMSEAAARCAAGSAGAISSLKDTFRLVWTKKSWQTVSMFRDGGHSNLKVVGFITLSTINSPMNRVERFREFVVWCCREQFSQAHIPDLCREALTVPQTSLIHLRCSWTVGTATSSSWTGNTGHWKLLAAMNRNIPNRWGSCGPIWSKVA